MLLFIFLTLIFSCRSPFPTQPAPLSFIIFLIRLLIDPICITVSLIPLHFPSALALLPPWTHCIATLRHYFLSFPFFFSKGNGINFLLYWCFDPFSFIPNFISKQQQVLKNYPFSPAVNLYYLAYCQHIHLTIRNLSTLGKQTRVVTTRCSSNVKTFALEMLGAVWRTPRKTGHEYQALEARKKEKKLCPVREHLLLPHRPDGEGRFCGRGSHGDLHYQSSLHSSHRLS